jgi:hypothetical protein
MIARIIQFEESPLHAPPVHHVNTLVLPSVPYIRDDDSTHSDATYSDKDSDDFVHVDERVVQPNEKISLDLQKCPGGQNPHFRQQTTLQRIHWIQGGLDLSMWILLMYFELLNQRCPCIVIWFNIIIHIPTLRLLEIHYGKQPCRGA